MGAYSESELRYCDAVANALLFDPDFREWFVGDHPFAPLLRSAKWDGDRARRLRKVPAFDRWWFNYWSGSGPEIETDILIVFEVSDGRNLAIHVEVKDERGRLIAGQAADYARRVVRWADPATRPRSVPPHDEAVAVLVCGTEAASDQNARLFSCVHTNAKLRQRLTDYPVDPS